MNLRIIGTSHISQESINEIRKVVEEYKPDIVAVELDVERAQALLSETKREMPLSAIRSIGIRGYLFAKIGQYVQQKLGKVVGVAPGSDMKAALKIAKSEKLDIALIDQPIKITLKNFSKNFTWREKGRFVADIFKGLFFPKKQIENLGLNKFDLRKVPKKEVLAKMMLELKNRYPSIYKVLVDDRNKYMVKKLVKLMRDKPGKKILAVVGAAHKEGMEELLLKVDVVN